MPWKPLYEKAGYGPNLGPLVVASSVWEVPDDLSSGNWSSANSSNANHEESDLYRLLEGAISHKAGSGRMAIADSKRLYKPGSGLRHLERAVHGTLTTNPKPAPNWSALVKRLGADLRGLRRQLPWLASARIAA